MKRTTLVLLAAALLAASAPAAMAQVSTTQTFGPRGSSATRTIHRGNVTITQGVSRGRFGRHGCNRLTRTQRTAFGVSRSSVLRCH